MQDLEVSKPGDSGLNFTNRTGSMPVKFQSNRITISSNLAASSLRLLMTTGNFICRYYVLNRLVSLCLDYMLIYETADWLHNVNVIIWLYEML